MNGFVRLHPRLLIAIAIGIVVFFLVGSQRSGLTAALAGWNAGCWSWIIMIAVMMNGGVSAKAHETRGDEDVGAWVVLLFVCTAAVVSMAAIVLELAAVHDGPRAYTAFHYLFAALTVSGSWLAVGFAFASHYAFLYFSADGAARPLKFPDRAESPEYWDFIYFSFTIAVAAQTSDVSVMTTAMRKLVVVQSVLGFLFNAAIIGFSINVFAGAIGH